jgi:hypothetical protein
MGVLVPGGELAWPPPFWMYCASGWDFPLDRCRYRHVPRSCRRQSLGRWRHYASLRSSTLPRLSARIPPKGKRPRTLLYVAGGVTNKPLAVVAP